MIIIIELIFSFLENLTNNYYLLANHILAGFIAIAIAIVNSIS
ncbi:hypothetical protein RINTHH_7330 [Richelia intracellularis HH01]|uniref:Uncharacterized protein n=1 Tax=Richelia intracellularis HH01 TaxID=1165094 RepID=M1WZK5_9NOST|nr:hypothetical protein RINTHH_7330 [Richelia intracellularis HH01]